MFSPLSYLPISAFLLWKLGWTVDQNEKTMRFRLRSGSVILPRNNISCIGVTEGVYYDLIQKETG